MSPKLTPKSAIIAGGATAVAIGGLAMAMAMGPAVAEESNLGSALNSLTGNTPQADASGLPHGPGEGRHGDGMRGPRVAIDGTVILSDDTFKAEDGTITVLRHQRGEVTAVSDSELTVKTGSVSRSYVLNADTVGDLANVAVGDEVGVRAKLVGATATAIDVNEMMAPPADGRGPEVDGDGHMDGQRGPEGMGRHMDGQRGPEGMGRHMDGQRGPEGMMADYGQRILEQTLVEQADGTLVTVREYRGEVVSVAGAVITLQTVDGVSHSFTVPESVTPERDRVAADLSDFAVGDDVRVEVTVSGGAESVIAVDGHAPRTGNLPDDGVNPNA